MDKTETEYNSTENKNELILKEAFLKGLSQLLVVIAGILFFFIVYKFDTIAGIAKRIISILTPIILGLVLAYLLNPVMVFFEKYLQNLLKQKIKSPKKVKSLSRVLAIILSFAVLLLFFYLLGSMVFPLIQDNIIKLANALPGEVEKFIKWLDSKDIHIEQYLQGRSGASGGGSSDMDFFSLDALIGYVVNWVRNDMLNQVSVVLNGVMGFFNMVLNIFVACVVAVYVLSDKEVFKRHCKKVIYALFNKNASEQIIHLIKQSDKIFGGFITGKIIDSTIIGVICFLGMMVLGIPYGALVSVIVGITNLIPFFGPYIGEIPTAILILLASPAKGIIYIVFVTLLQQFDGNILGPRILGESTGLSPFWIIFAIMLGGGLFGIIGMLIGVPTFAVIYYLFKSYINHRLEKKQIKA